MSPKKSALRTVKHGGVKKKVVITEQQVLCMRCLAQKCCTPTAAFCQVAERVSKPTELAGPMRSIKLRSGFVKQTPMACAPRPPHPLRMLPDRAEDLSWEQHLANPAVARILEEQAERAHKRAVTWVS